MSQPNIIAINPTDANLTENHKRRPRGGGKVSRIHPLGKMNVCTNFMSINLVVAEMIQSEPK